uniref:Uncharacterized protein n=1 Tax=Xiphophorus couchianus TaxID=32473 RepID=A0A3B5MCD9_9TELE
HCDSFSPWNNANGHLIALRIGRPDSNGYTPLHIAAKKNQMDIGTTLLEYGADTNAVTRQGISPIHLAAQEGSVDLVSLLLAKNANVNVCNKVTDASFYNPCWKHVNRCCLKQI